MSPFSPRIAVLMPIYNGGPYVAEAIESLLAQTYPHFDIFILNDGSTDNTEEIIRSYSDPRLKLINNPHNMGLIATLNRGLDLICADEAYTYIARMDGDDISLPTRFEKQVAWLDSNPDIVICGTALKQFGLRSQKIMYPDGCGITKYSYLIGATPMAHPTWMFRCAVIKENGYRYHRGYTHAEDLKFLLDIFRDNKNRAVNLLEVLYLYRWQGQNVSHRAREHQVQMAIKVRREEVEHLISRSLSDSESEWVQMRFKKGDAQGYINFIDEILRAIHKSDPCFVRSLEGRHFFARMIALALYLNRKSLRWGDAYRMIKTAFPNKMGIHIVRAIFLIVRSSLLVRYNFLSLVFKGPVSGF